MWHGGGFPGVTYETKPDGGEGWLTGSENGAGTFTTLTPWSAVAPAGRCIRTCLHNRAGVPADGQPLGTFPHWAGAREATPRARRIPGTQFPVEHYEDFVRQNVPRWTSNDTPTIAAYTALVDKVCPCVVLFHSQAGQFGYKVAQARPEKIKALIAVEPAAVWRCRAGGSAGAIPTLVSLWRLHRAGRALANDPRNGVAFADAVNKAGGKVEVVDLPKVGIKGNSHMIMMDRNSSEVAAYIQAWLERQGLFRSSGLLKCARAVDNPTGRFGQRNRK